MSGQINSLQIQIPLPDNFAALVEKLQTAADEIKREIETIQALKEQRLSYSEEETAQQLNCSVIYLERIRRNNKISYSRVAGRPRYTPEQIKDYLASIQTTRTGGKK